MSISARAVYDEKGQVVYHDGIMKDITDVKNTREALKASEQQYRTTIDYMGDAIHLIDRDLRIVLFNKSLTIWCRNIGMTTEPFGKSVFEVFPFLPETVKSEYEKVFDSGNTLITEEVTIIGKNKYITETRKIPFLTMARLHVL